MLCLPAPNPHRRTIRSPVVSSPDAAGGSGAASALIDVSITVYQGKKVGDATVLATVASGGVALDPSAPVSAALAMVNTSTDEGGLGAGLTTVSSDTGECLFQGGYTSARFPGSRDHWRPPRRLG